MQRERGQLLKSVFLNCSTDGVTLCPLTEKAFDLISQRAKNEGLVGPSRRFSNRSRYLSFPVGRRYTRGPEVQGINGRVSQKDRAPWDGAIR